MGIASNLINPTYVPEADGLLSYAEKNISFKKIIKCPVPFTSDPIEYATSYLGYTLKPLQKQVLEDLFSVDTKGKPKYSEAVLVCGMRSSKSVCAGIIGSFLAQMLLSFDDPGRHLGQVPGQKLSAEYIATSEQQSQKTAYASCETVILNSPWWKKYLSYLAERELTEGKETLFQCHAKRIAFVEKNVEIVSLHSNSQSLAGLTAFFVCFDEMSRFDISEGVVQEKSEKRSAQSVYFTAARAAKTLAPFSKILTVTSPMYEDDFGMQLLCMAGTLRGGAGLPVVEALRSRRPNRVSSMLGYHYSTFEANPKTEDDPFGYSESDFAAERSANPSAYSRDYLAIPPSAISPFFELPERIDSSVVKDYQPMIAFEDIIIEESVGIATRKYIAKKMFPIQTNKMNKYFICCDQGATKDSFAVAMGHGQEELVEIENPNGTKTQVPRFKVVIDLVEAWKPNKEERITVSFTNVEDVIRAINKMFYIGKVVYDSWNSVESIERLFSEGIFTEKMGATVPMYETMKLLLYSGMVELPPSDLLVTELKQLNNIKGKQVQHPTNGSKDLADAVVRTIWCIYTDCIRDAIHGNFMLPYGQKFSTLRSIASAFELMKQKQLMDGDLEGMNSPLWSHDQSSIFGRGSFVRGNVRPNIETNPSSYSKKNGGF